MKTKMHTRTIEPALQTGRGKPIETDVFDAMFENGEDISEHVDWTSARRPNLVVRRVNVDFPVWVVEALDGEAERLGVTRQALIKIWITDRLATLDPSR